MLITPNWPGTSGLASMSILRTLTRPSYSVASSSTIGAIILQGLHHAAQKSTRTGTSESRTSDLKVVSVTSAALAIGFSWGSGGRCPIVTRRVGCSDLRDRFQSAAAAAVADDDVLSGLDAGLGLGAGFDEAGEVEDDEPSPELRESVL